MYYVRVHFHLNGLQTVYRTCTTSTENNTVRVRSRGIHSIFLIFIRMMCIVVYV